MNDALIQLKKTTVARIGIDRAGTRFNTATYLKFRADHAVAMDAVWSSVDEKVIEDLGFIKVQTLVPDKEHYITRPDLGRRFSDETNALIKEACMDRPDVQIIVADGLSSPAITVNVKDIYGILIDGLQEKGYRVGTPIFIRYGRVATMDRISGLLNAKVTILLVGERPGLATGESMSCYMAYEASVDKPESQRTVISNIHSKGTPPVEAGAQIVDLVGILKFFRPSLPFFCFFFVLFSAISSAWRSSAALKLLNCIKSIQMEAIKMNIYDLNVKELDPYKGKVILVLNSATKCGFTPQYDALQDLYEAYESDGFVILDFPCNQFGNQAPGTNEEIVTFCDTTFGVTFPIFSKIEVNGDNAHPLFKFLVSEKGFAGFDPDHQLTPILEKMLSEADSDYKSKPSIKWNFTKFLIDKKGEVVERFEPTEDLEIVEDKIKNLLF